MHAAFTRATLSVCAGIMLCAATPVFAQSVPGFRKTDSAKGITVWNKSNDYVQVVSPSEGGRIQLLQGKQDETGTWTTYARMDIRDWWKEWKKEEPDAFSIANGQFFNMDDPLKAPIAFPLKADGMVHPGYGDTSEYNGNKVMLTLGDDRFSVEEYSDDATPLYSMREDAIVALKPAADKQKNRRRGRTFIGVNDDGNALIFTSPTATQRYAQRILLAFGAGRNDIIMLDGGDSTQMIVKGKLLVPKRVTKTLRTIPQAIGTYSTSR